MLFEFGNDCEWMHQKDKLLKNNKSEVRARLIRINFTEELSTNMIVTQNIKCVWKVPTGT